MTPTELEKEAERIYSYFDNPTMNRNHILSEIDLLFENIRNAALEEAAATAVAVAWDWQKIQGKSTLHVRLDEAIRALKIGDGK